MKDAIAICRETTQDPERQARAAGEDLPWNELAFVLAYSKLSRVLGQDDKFSAAIKASTWAVQPGQALREIPDVIAYLARFYGINIEKAGKADEGTEAALCLAERICSEFKEREYPRLLIGYDEPGSAIYSVYTILSKFVGLESNEQKLTLTVDHAAILPLIPNLIARLNRAYVALASSVHVGIDIGEGFPKSIYWRYPCVFPAESQSGRSQHPTENQAEPLSPSQIGLAEQFKATGEPDPSLLKKCPWHGTELCHEDKDCQLLRNERIDDKTVCPFDEEGKR